MVISFLAIMSVLLNRVWFGRIISLKRGMQLKGGKLLLLEISSRGCLSDQAPVVRKVDSAIHWISYYPLDSTIGFCNTYPLDSDLSSG